MKTKSVQVEVRDSRLESKDSGLVGDFWRTVWKLQPGQEVVYPFPLKCIGNHRAALAALNHIGEGRRWSARLEGDTVAVSRVR